MLDWSLAVALFLFLWKITLEALRMEKSVVKHETISELVRILSPFSSSSGVVPFSFVMFGSGRARVTDGILGVDAPGSMLDGVSLPLTMLSGPALSTKSDVQMQIVDKHVLIKAGNFKGRFPTAPKEASVTWPDTPQKKDWAAFPPGAWTAAQSVLFAADKGQRMALSAVRFLSGQALTTDGVRLARASAKGVPDGFLPSRFLEACAMAFPEAAPEAIVPDLLGRVWLRFRNTLCWSMLSAEEFPDSILKIAMQRSKDAGPGFSARWESPAATEAIARVALFSGAGLSVRAEGKKLTFHAQSQFGEVEDSVTTEVARGFELSASPALLTDAFGRAACCAVAASSECLVFRKQGWELIVMAMASQE